VIELLHEMDYSLQANRKNIRGEARNMPKLALIESKGEVARVRHGAVWDVRLRNYAENMRDRMTRTSFTVQIRQSVDLLELRRLHPARAIYRYAMEVALPITEYAFGLDDIRQATGF
jgi:hypothetical protein